MVFEYDKFYHLILCPVPPIKVRPEDLEPLEDGLSEDGDMVWRKPDDIYYV